MISVSSWSRVIGRSSIRSRIAQLAAVEAQALEQARARQQLLAAAAPRAYGNGRLAAVGQFEDDDSYGSGGGGGSGGPSPGGGGLGGGRARATRDYIIHKNRDDNDQELGGGEGTADDGAEGRGGVGAGSSRGAAGLNTSAVAGEDGRSPVAPGGTASAGIANDADGTGGSGGSDGNSSPPAGSAPDKNLVPDGYQDSQGAAFAAGTAGPPGTRPPSDADERRREKERVMAPENRGKDWALKQNPPKSVPVRRTIRVTVGNDKLAILPDSGPAMAGGKVIPMPGDTVESVDEFVKQVRDHIDGWGIAGTNLYWRPVVVLSVGPDGQQRASDLARLLKNSGLELKTDETAKVTPHGGAHETR